MHYEQSIGKELLDLAKEIDVVRDGFKIFDDEGTMKDWVDKLGGLAAKVRMSGDILSRVTCAAETPPPMRPMPHTYTPAQVQQVDREVEEEKPEETVYMKTRVFGDVPFSRE